MTALREVYLAIPAEKRRMLLGDLDITEPSRPGWSAARPAVLAELLRSKFHTYPTAADVLPDTAEAHLTYTDPDDFLAGRTGTLREMVRAELAAQRSGITTGLHHR